MVYKVTTYIVGAGASKEAFADSKDPQIFPSGIELTDRIAELFSYNIERDQFAGFVNESVNEWITHINYKKTNTRGISRDLHKQYIKAANLIRNSMALTSSIDNFLYSHSKKQADEFEMIELLSKAAIIYLLLKAESRSSLKQVRNHDFYKMYYPIKNSWLIKFFRNLTKLTDRDEIKEKLKNTKFIIFNYDRCVEIFLHNSLKYYFGLSLKEIAEYYSLVEIVHAYGKIGTLEYDGDPNFTDFGYHDIDTNKLIDNCESIRTFSESVESKEIDKIHEIIKLSRKLIFLGFSYDDLNIKLLTDNINYDKRAYVNIYGTAYNFSDHSINKTKSRLAHKFKTIVSKINLENKTCSELFDYFHTEI